MKCLKLWLYKGTKVSRETRASIMWIEEEASSETSTAFYQAARCHAPQDSNIYIRHRENVTPHLHVIDPLKLRENKTARMLRNIPCSATG